MEYKDYYKILGVDRNSTEAQVKSAYRKLARKYHPDVSKEKNAADKFKDINEAYEVLSDKEKRSRYDSLGANWQAGADFTPPPGFEGFNFNRGFGGRQRVYSQGFEDLGGFSDFFSSIFGDFMNTGASSSAGPKSRFTHDDFYTQPQRQTASRAPQKEEDLDLTQNLYVNAKDLMQDKPLNVKLNMMEKCRQCKGPGSICPACSGAGMYTESRNLSVKLPKGVKEDQKIRLAKEGKIGDSGQKGDLYFVIKFKDNEYKIDGDDLTKSLDITPPQAVIGYKKDINTLHGNVNLKIPPNTRNGKIFRLKDLGLPKKSGGFGNLNVKVNINIPENLSEKETSLYKKLYDLEN